MITTESVVIRASESWAKRIGDDEFRLRAIPNERRLPFDVLIDAFGYEEKYERFGECVVGDRPGLFAARVDVAIGSTSRKFLAVVGLYGVLFFDCAERDVREVLRLFRAERDDRGFYRIQLHALKDGFLINYEGGIARVMETGKVVWHRQMLWNDVYMRLENSRLLFNNESNPRGFYISIADGRKSPL